MTENDRAELKDIIREHGSWMEWCFDLNISAGTCNEMRHSGEEYSIKVIKVTEAYLNEVWDPCWEDIVWVLCKVRKRITPAKELARKHHVHYDSLCTMS